MKKSFFMIVQQALVTLPHSVYEPDTDQVINMSTLNRPIFRIFPQIRRVRFQNSTVD
ncbi:unnamed protein product [Tenebrio molitor]|nr:unnamed protein product [Tenebrio molitor]